jgi:hypothetical protein
LFSFRSLSPEWWRGFYYYDCQSLLFATAIVFAEVVANAIGLNKKTNGIVPGVWSPLFIASLSFTLFDLAGYAILSSSTNSGFFAATDIKVMLLRRLLLSLPVRVLSTVCSRSVASISYLLVITTSRVSASPRRLRAKW